MSFWHAMRAATALCAAVLSVGGAHAQAVPIVGSLDLDYGYTALSSHAGHSDQWNGDGGSDAF